MTSHENTLNHPVFYDEPESNYLASFLNYHKKGNEKIFVLVDDNTRSFCLPMLLEKLPRQMPATIIAMQSGEKNKTIQTCMHIWEQLNAHLADRNSLLINLGGGVVCDVGGFAASVYKRGIRFIHIPTTLMAMADASIGGKTGVDLHGLKNNLGTFQQPIGVFIFPEFLKTLPERELYNGFAEMLKHGIIYESNYFMQLSEKGPENLTSDGIRISVEIKSGIVLKDPTEKGIRKVLNFGHTIGHALESYSLLNDNEPLLHGEAVVLGMMAELLLSEKKQLTSQTEVDPILSHLLNYAVLYNLSDACINSVMGLISNDKKSIEGVPGFSLFRKPGHIVTGIECDTDMIRDALIELRDILSNNQ